MNLQAFFLFLTAIFACSCGVRRDKIDFTAIADSFNYDLRLLKDLSCFSRIEQTFVREILGSGDLENFTFLPSFRYLQRILREQDFERTDKSGVISKIVAVTFAGDEDLKEICIALMGQDMVSEAALSFLVAPTRKIFDRTFAYLIENGANMSAIRLLIQISEFKLSPSQLYHIMTWEYEFDVELLRMMIDGNLVSLNEIYRGISMASTEFICAYFDVCIPPIREKILFHCIKAFRESDLIEDLVEHQGDLSPALFVAAIEMGYEENFVAYLRCKLDCWFDEEVLREVNPGSYTEEFIGDMAVGDEGSTNCIRFRTADDPEYSGTESSSCSSLE